MFLHSSSCESAHIFLYFWRLFVSFAREKFFKLCQRCHCFTYARVRFPLKKKSCEKKSRVSKFSQNVAKNERSQGGNVGRAPRILPIRRPGVWSNRDLGRHRMGRLEQRETRRDTRRKEVFRVQTKRKRGGDETSEFRARAESRAWDGFRLRGEGEVQVESQDAQLEKRLVFGGKAKKTDENEEEDVTIELKTKLSLQKKLDELERILLPNARLERVTGRAARTEDDEREEARPSSLSLNEEEGEEVLAKTFNANATHVDVSGNLMTSFVELGKIGKYFRNLEILDASDRYDEGVGDIESGDAISVEGSRARGFAV